MSTPDGAAPLAPPEGEAVLMTSACQARYDDADSAPTLTPTPTPTPEPYAYAYAYA